MSWKEKFPQDRYYESENGIIYNGDALNKLKQFSDKSIDCVITSPPYWRLRSYKVNNQLGQEKTFEDYINNLCNIFDEVKRVLKKAGTCWVVIGDTYNDNKQHTIPNNSLCLIPFRFGIEMENRGWTIKNIIIWKKLNAMPSSVRKRFTIDFEYIFFFVKDKNYYFEQQLEKAKTPGSIHKSRKGDKGSQIKETTNRTYFNRDYTTGNYRNKRSV